MAVKRREVKSKGEKERYSHLNAEFQRIARRDKKDFLRDQCKELEENNRMGNQEISSLSHSVVFLYFFALITEEGFFISPCYSLELCIQMLISFLFSFASSDSYFAFLCFLFMGMVLTPVSSTM